MNKYWEVTATELIKSTVSTYRVDASVYNFLAFNSTV